MARAITSAHSRTASARSRTLGPALKRSRLRHLLRGPDGISVTILLGPDSDVGRALARGDDTEAHTLLAWWQRTLPGAVALEVLVGVLDHDDRGVHHRADGDGDAAEAHDVRVQPHPLHRHHRDEDAHRKHHDRHQRAAQVQQEIGRAHV